MQEAATTSAENTNSTGITTEVPSVPGGLAADINQYRTDEINKLKLQFKDRVEVQEDGNILLKSFKTTDPDFNHKLLPDGIDLIIKFPEEFPQKRCKIIVVQSEKLPKKSKSSLQKTINNKLFLLHKNFSRNKGKIIRTALKELDRRIGLDEALKNIAEEKKAAWLEKRGNDSWSLAQQLRLEEALGAFTSTTVPDAVQRWNSISACVPGKSPQQCLDRYNKIRAEILQSKEEEKQRIETIRENRAKARKPKESTLAQRNDVASESSDEGEEPIAVLTVEDFESFPASEGSKVDISRLEIRGISYLEPAGIAALFGCLHCGLSFDKVFKTSSDSFKFWCPNKKCGHLLTGNLKPVGLHETNKQHVSILDSASLIMTDVQLISFVATCLECNEREFIHNCSRGTPAEIVCKTCHKKLWMLFQNVEIDDNRKLVAQNGSLGRRKTQRDPRIIPGKPLPKNGICRHYRKSHRWFRFPCCNKVFPCDVCHDLASQCEETKRANRQVCGFCAHEQIIANNKPCSKCGKNIGAQRFSSHWEGGKGCRNKVLMNRKDQKKHAGRFKTQSNKSERVGKKAKDKITKKTRE